VNELDGILAGACYDECDGLLNGCNVWQLVVGYWSKI